ncbi:AMP-binding protein [[Clostridium] polysaccharolyticum]|uniref:AMP-binding protein n=1 Tax=[Clostridium] polysaccharolyticum TaxID=29364 RepID=UPI000B8520E5|nr:AMP-binding protein [[Clostridium] polysaccharolyticum]
MTDKICLLAKGLSSLGVTERSHVAIVAPECRQKNMFYLATVGLGAIPICLHENTEIEKSRRIQGF